MESEQKNQQYTSPAEIPKADPETPSIVEAKKYEAEYYATNSRQTDENVSYSISETKDVELEVPATNVQHTIQSSDVPIVETKLMVEQPAVFSPKPDIAETGSQCSFVPENETKSQVERTPAPMPSSKSEPIEVAAGLELESKPKKKSTKYKKRKSTTKSDASQSTTSLTSKDSSETLKSSFMTESTEHFVTAQSSPNPSLTSGPSEICLCAADPNKTNSAGDTIVSSPFENKHQPVIKHSKTDSNASVSSTPKSTFKSGKKQRQNHSKTDSNSSAISTGSVRKVDKKSVKSNENTDEKAKPAAGDKVLRDTQKENVSSLAVNPEYSTQWPSLGPTKVPLSSVVDCKLTAPPTLCERKKNPNGPIIPAVPLNMQRRRPS